MRKPTIRPFILPLLLIFCTLFYYFGELVDWAAWNALRESFFYGVHDVHRLLFLAPIVYAAYTARVKGAVIITLVSFIIFLPRAFFISPFPDPLLRMSLFTLFAGAVGVLVGVIRDQTERAGKLEAVMTTQRDRSRLMMDTLPEGVVVIGPDHRVRFTNETLRGELGEGTGVACHQYLGNATSPCPDCRLTDVIDSGVMQGWVCPAGSSRRYQALGALYVDADGTRCGIAALREMPQHQ
jgi:hypothetical protein